MYPFSIGVPRFESYFDLSLYKYSQQNFTLEIFQLSFINVWELGAELAAESTAKLILVPSEKDCQCHKHWMELLQNYVVGFFFTCMQILVECDFFSRLPLVMAFFHSTNEKQQLNMRTPTHPQNRSIACAPVECPPGVHLQFTRSGMRNSTSQALTAFHFRNIIRIFTAF